MAETFPQSQNRKKQEGLGSLRDNFYNFAKKSGQSVGPTIGAMFNSYTAGLNTLFGRDEDAIRDRNQRDAYLKRRDAIQTNNGEGFGVGTKPLSDFEIEKKLLESSDYQESPTSNSFLSGLGFNKNISSEEQELLDQKKASLLASREEGVNASNDSSEFSNTPVVDPIVDEEADFERYSGPFEDIYETINKREIAPKKQALADEKTNLDAFPKLSIAETAQAEDAQRKMDAKTEAEAGYEDGGEDAYEKLQNSALEDIAKSKGEKVTPATREELLAKYKKEFYEATGLDSSGKADKSSALMAMGLALMQNKAGKGFNVGKMLSAVGEAGEKALPALTKAKAAAKAETVAAGKYALGRIQAGESASAALAKEARSYKKEIYLKRLQIESEAAKAKAKGIEYKNVSAIDVVKDVPLSYGVFDGRSILAKPLAESRGIVGAYNRYSHAQTILNEMENNLQSLANANSPTLTKIVDRVKGVAVGLGITSASQAFGEELISPETSTDNKRRLLINEYKRLLLQESQVSDLDLRTLELSFGNSGLFGNVEQQINSLQNMKNYFSTQQDKTYEALMQMKLTELYTNQNEYNNTQKYISDNLDKTYTIIPLSQQSNTKSIATLDISKGG